MHSGNFARSWKVNNKSEKAIKSIGRSIANINRQIEVLREEFPNGGIYVENGDNFNIMKGDTHTSDSAGSPLHDNVLESFILMHSDCGGW